MGTADAAIASSRPPPRLEICSKVAGAWNALPAVVRTFTSALASGAVGACGPPVARDFLLVTPSLATTSHSLEGAEHGVRELLAAFPDARVTVERVGARSGAAYLRIAFEGTQTGPLLGILMPRGRRVRTVAEVAVAYEDDAITGCMATFDARAFFRQLTTSQSH